MHVIVIDQSHDDPTNTLGAMMWPIMGAQKKSGAKRHSVATGQRLKAAQLHLPAP